MSVRLFEPDRISAILAQAVNDLTSKPRAIEFNWFGQRAKLSLSWCDRPAIPVGTIVKLQIDDFDFYVSASVLQDLDAVRDLLQDVAFQDLEEDLQTVILEIGCSPLLDQLRSIGKIELGFMPVIPDSLTWLRLNVSGRDTNNSIASCQVGMSLETLRWLPRRLTSVRSSDRCCSRSFQIPIHLIGAEVFLAHDELAALEVGDLIMLNVDSNQTPCIVRTECGECYQGTLTDFRKLEVFANKLPLGKDRETLDEMGAADVLFGTGSMTSQVAAEGPSTTWRPFPGNNLVLRFGCRNIAIGRLVTLRDATAMSIDRVFRQKTNQR